MQVQAVQRHKKDWLWFCKWVRRNVKRELNCSLKLFTGFKCVCLIARDVAKKGANAFVYIYIYICMKSELGDWKSAITLWRIFHEYFLLELVSYSLLYLFCRCFVHTKALIKWSNNSLTNTAASQIQSTRSGSSVKQPPAQRNNNSAVSHEKRSAASNTKRNEQREW